MSLLELVGSILTELEEVKSKLDRLLAVGSARQTEKEMIEKEIGVNIDVIEALLPEALQVEKTIIKGGTTIQEEEFDNTPIIWTKHDGKKFKTCKYKCGNYVSWDNTTKKYLHYDAEFKLIGHDCPKYATSGVFKD